MINNDLRIMTLSAGTVQEAIDKWVDAANVVSINEIQSNDIPADRYFRNGWVFRTGIIDFNLHKCKNIQLNKIRRKRNPKLDDTDKEMFRARDNDDTVKQDELKIERRRLRDITEPLKALQPTDIQEIIDAWPPEFPHDEPL